MKTVKVIQFGYNVKVPSGIPLVDCQHLPNPYPKYAHDHVAARHHVRSSPHFEGCVQRALVLFDEEHPVIGIGCGYGVHRSGCVVEEVQRRFAKDGWDVEVEKIGKA